MAFGTDGQEEIIVRRATRLPEEHRRPRGKSGVSVLGLLLIVIIIAGTVLLVVYKDVIVPPRQPGEPVGGAPVTGSEEALEIRPPANPERDLEPQPVVPQVPVTPKEVEEDRLAALQLVQQRQVSPYHPLTRYERTVIQRNWQHVIAGCSPKDVQRFLDMLDMCYDEDGGVRDMTFEEITEKESRLEKSRPKSPLFVDPVGAE